MSDQDAGMAADDRQEAPCGSWSSPFGIDMVACGQRSLSSLRADVDMLYWHERRPDQGPHHTVALRPRSARRMGSCRTEDIVVPIGQARAMAAAMRDLGIPHALHEFDGEGHGFRRAETTRRMLELELAIYRDVFGFTLAAP